MWKKLKRWLFGSTSALGNEKHFPVNRKQRRAHAAIERKRKNRRSHKEF